MKERPEGAPAWSTPGPEPGREREHGVIERQRLVLVEAAVAAAAEAEEPRRLRRRQDQIVAAAAVEVGDGQPLRPAGRAPCLEAPVLPGDRQARAVDDRDLVDPVAVDVDRRQATSQSPPRWRSQAVPPPQARAGRTTRRAESGERAAWWHGLLDGPTARLHGECASVCAEDLGRDQPGPPGSDRTAAHSPRHANLSRSPTELVLACTSSVGAH